MALARPDEEKQSVEEPVKYSCADLMSDAIHGSPFDLSRVTNLVLPGGGAKGMILLSAVGALGIMDQIENIAATSIGTFIAAGLGMGLTPDYMMIKSFWGAKHEQLSKFADVTNPVSLKDSYVKTLFHGVKNMHNYGGFFLGDHIEERVVEMLMAAENKLPDEYRKADLTLLELHELKSKYPEKHLKDIYCTAWDCKTNQGVMLCWESKEFRDLPIKKAVRYSMSVPFVYRPGDGRFWDGALSANVPIDTFDHQRYLPPHEELWNGKNMRTLALTFISIKPKSVKKPEPALVTHPFSLPSFSFFLKEIKKKILQPFWLEDKIMRAAGEDCRIFYVDATSIDSANFALQTKRLEEIFASGYDQGREFVAYHKKRAQSRTMRK